MRTMTWLRNAGLMLALSGLVVAGTLSAAEPTVIHIDNFTFSPQTLTVPKGTTVEWVNRDDTPHRLVATQAQFKSPVLDTEEKFSWTFTEAGSFAYFCSLHPHMTGTVVVAGD